MIDCWFYVGGVGYVVWFALGLIVLIACFIFICDLLCLDIGVAALKFACCRAGTL